ncbi:MAG: hypothetical protein Q9197_000464 [Variospora fuerteventurae]
MPESERSEDRLAQEAQVIVGGGTVTTARTLTFVSYYILSIPEMQEKLRNELQDTMATYPQSIPSWADLERLPYLQAIIKEDCRGARQTHLSDTSSGPSRLVYVQVAFMLCGEKVPVGMCSYFMHTDPAVFPEPRKFIPERWLGDYDPKMNRNFVAFGRGSRSCLGMK